MGLFLLACAAFVSLGLPDAALGVAWPELRRVFALPQTAMGLILAATSVGYMTSSASAGWLVPRLGVGRLLAWSTALVALGVFGFALAEQRWLLLAAALVGGLGSGAIDAGLNAHAAAHFSPKRMNWLHAAYGLGAATGPVILTTAFAAGQGYRTGYGGLALVLLSMTLLFTATRTLWRGDPVASGPAPDARGGRLRGRALLHLAAFFVYTGVEVGAGQWSFTVLTEARGLTPAAAGSWTAAYWTALFLGRVLVGFVADTIGPRGLVRLGVLLLIAGTTLFTLAPMPLAGLGLVLAGLAAAPIFPMLMSITAQVFEPRFATRLVGLQVTAAMLGALALPTLAGATADLASPALVPPLVLGAALILALVSWPLTARKR